MNARQALLENEKLVVELYENSVTMSERTGKSIEECIDHKVNFYVRKSKSTNEELAWENRGVEAKKLIDPVETYDIHFNDDENSNNKDFELTLEEAKNYIAKHNGTNESYFEDYKGGSVSIVNNRTGENVYEEEVK